MYQIGQEEEYRNPEGAGSRANNDESESLLEEIERPRRTNARVSLTKESAGLHSFRRKMQRKLIKETDRYIL